MEQVKIVEDNFQIFKRLSSTNFTWSTLEYFVPNNGQLLVQTLQYDDLNNQNTDPKQDSNLKPIIKKLLRKLSDKQKIFTTDKQLSDFTLSDKH